jgi:hypothetical protein
MGLLAAGLKHQGKTVDLLKDFSGLFAGPEFEIGVGFRTQCDYCLFGVQFDGQCVNALVMAAIEGVGEAEDGDKAEDEPLVDRG